LLFFFIFQLYGLITTGNDILNSYYILVSIIAICFTISSYNKNLETVSYYICLLILGLIIIVYSYLNYRWLLTTNYLQLYGTWPHVYWPIEKFSNNIIRSSGLSRSNLIFFFPIFFILLINRLKYIFLIPYLFLVTNIYLTQSRTVLFFYIPFVIFAIFYFLRNKNLKHILIKFFILLLLPIIFSYSLLTIKEEVRTKRFTTKIINKIQPESSFNLEKKIVKKHREEFVKLGCDKIPTDYSHTRADPAIRDLALKCDVLRYKQTGFLKAEFVRALDPFSITSNRFNYWKEVVAASNRPIAGYGPLGDKFLIGKNSHNLLIYSYASGGLISVIFIMILIARYTYVCIFLTFFKKIPLTNKNIVLFSSIFTTSFLIFRGITQVGIGVFSIDLLVFLSCICICEKSLTQK